MTKSAAFAESTEVAPKSARAGRKTRENKKQENAAVAAKDQTLEATKPQGPLVDLTALVVPPYSLPKNLMDRIRESYSVIEVEKLRVSELVGQLPKPGSKGSKAPLIVLSSLDGINQEIRQCNLKLFAYKCTEQFMKEPCDNFYLDSDKFYAHRVFKDVTSASSIREEVKKMVKVANSPNLIKLTNPARMHLSNEDDLMIVLQLQEPPSADASVADLTEEIK